MSTWYPDNAESIGRTPLVRLNRVLDGAQATVLAKIEGRNRYVTFEDRVADEVSRRLDSHSFVRNVVTSWPGLGAS